MGTFIDETLVPFRSNLFHFLYYSSNFKKAPGKSSCELVNYLLHSLFHLLNCLNSGVLTSLFFPQLSSSLTDSQASLNLFCHSKSDAQFMQDGQKAVWSIPYVSVAFFKI